MHDVLQIGTSVPGQVGGTGQTGGGQSFKQSNLLPSLQVVGHGGALSQRKWFTSRTVLQSTSAPATLHLIARSGHVVPVHVCITSPEEPVPFIDNLTAPAESCVFVTVKRSGPKPASVAEAGTISPEGSFDTINSTGVVMEFNRVRVTHCVTGIELAEIIR